MSTIKWTTIIKHIFNGWIFISILIINYHYLNRIKVVSFFIKFSSMSVSYIMRIGKRKIISMNPGKTIGSRLKTLWK